MRVSALTLPVLAGLALVIPRPAAASSACPANDPKMVIADVQAMFDAAASGNQAAARAHYTEEAYLFDGGARYSADGILNVIRDNRKEGKTYIWKVTDPDVRFFCDTATIAYVNRGAVIKNGHATPAMWLESMILKASGGHWLIEFAHSTKAASPAPSFFEQSDAPHAKTKR